MEVKKYKSLELKFFNCVEIGRTYNNLYNCRVQQLMSVNNEMEATPFVDTYYNISIDKLREIVSKYRRTCDIKHTRVITTDMNNRPLPFKRVAIWYILNYSKAKKYLEEMNI
jgi:hypothetical protein